MITYEQFLGEDIGRGFRDASLHFENASRPHKTLRRIAGRLDDLGIPYATIGTMALFFHGYRRFTEDVDLIVTAEDFKTIHRLLIGDGYARDADRPRSLRDSETGVRIDFLLAGEYPGDRKPKPVSFPHPTSDVVIMDGIRLLSLPRMFEILLAAASSRPQWLKHLVLVQETLKRVNAPDSMADEMHPSVREAFLKELRFVRELPAEDY